MNSRSNKNILQISKRRDLGYLEISHLEQWRKVSKNLLLLYALKIHKILKAAYRCLKTLFNEINLKFQPPPPSENYIDMA